MMSTPTNSGIQTSGDGSSYIPSSRRADGSTRKEIRVRPGWTPQEDVKTYKSRTAEAWKTKGSDGVPGAEAVEKAQDSASAKSKNAKRREAAKKKQSTDGSQGAVTESEALNISMEQVKIVVEGQHIKEKGQEEEQEAEMERQKKIRNQLKKLKAVKELRLKKANGEKLSPDQLMKLGKEEELLRDLKKLGYEGSEAMTDNNDLIPAKSTGG